MRFRFRVATMGFPKWCNQMSKYWKKFLLVRKKRVQLVMTLGCRITMSVITCKMHYYFSSTYTFSDLDFIDFCNIMLVLCVYFRYLSVKVRRVSK